MVYPMIVKVTYINGNGKRDWNNKEENTANKLKVARGAQ